MIQNSYVMDLILKSILLELAHHISMKLEDIISHCSQFVVLD
jgi:hypothetical protein